MAKNVTPLNNGKLPVEEFVTRAIRNLRENNKPINGVKSKGIHSVFSGFNAAFKEYYGEKADPVATTKDLTARGVIASHGAKRGAMLYLPGDMPSGGATVKVLGQILG